MTCDSILSDAQRLLGELASRLRDLDNSLQRERVLIGKDATALEANAADKSRLVMEIEHINQTVSRVIGTHDIQAWITDSGDSRLQKAWQTCLDLMRACSHLNMLNATLIEQQQQKVVDLLTILSGNETGNAIYDAHGETRSPTLSRSLGKG